MTEKIRIVNALDDRELEVSAKAFAQGAYPGYELVDEGDADVVEAMAPARPAVQQERTTALITRDDVPAPDAVPAVTPAPAPDLGVDVEATVDVDELDLDDLEQHLALHPEERAALLAAEHDGQGRPEFLELLERSTEPAQSPATADVNTLNANQVLDHLAGHPEERAALLEAELKGKNRKTVVAALQPQAPEEG